MVTGPELVSQDPDITDFWHTLQTETCVEHEQDMVGDDVW